MPLPSDYIYAGILVALTIVIAASMAALPQVLGVLLGIQRPSKAKLKPYECGIEPTGAARVRFSVKFYLVAMVFILFDIEAVFFYPWAVVHRWLGWFGLMELGVFIAILAMGYIYVWKRGGLQWE
jgi:NADH-quinone oxidoreductase subunit A